MNLLIIISAAITAWVLTAAQAFCFNNTAKKYKNDVMRYKCNKIRNAAFNYYKTFMPDDIAFQNADSFTKDAFYKGLINEKFKMMREYEH